MGIAYYVSTLRSRRTLMLAPAVFAFGLVAFGFLGMGPVTIAVDSYGPVTDNAQSVFELSVIEQHSRHQGSAQARVRLRRALRARQGSARRERRRRQHVQGDGEAGADRHRRRRRDDDDLLDHRGADRRADGEPRQAVAAAPAVLARPDHRRRGDLLVHRRVGAGGDDRRVSRGRVHQGEHQARRRARRRRSRTARRSSRSARSTRRRGCSTSS